MKVLGGLSWHCETPSLAHLELPVPCQKPIGILARVARHFAYIIENESALVRF